MSTPDDDPRLEPFRALTGRGDDGPWIVVEGAEPVRRLLASDWPVASVVCTPAQAEALAPALTGARAGLRPVVRTAEQLRALTGFEFHRGCLAAAPRSAVPGALPDDCLEALAGWGHATLLVADGLSDPRNVGALVRTARALHADAMLVGAAGADPFSRRAVRASMGHVFHLPLAVSHDLPGELVRLRARLGARLVVAAFEDGATPVQLAARGGALLLAVGNEGAGVGPDVRALADEVVMIPMRAEVDSLNVAVAAGVLLHALRG